MQRGDLMSRKMNEADTRSKLIDPMIKAARWQENQIQREYKVSAGRIHFDGKKGKRERAKSADYLLRYRPSVPIAVVEAKKEELSHLDGLNQAKEYAKKLGLRFAYTTNGHEIEFIDLLHDTQETVSKFHSPEELWNMFNNELDPVNTEWTEALLHDYFVETGIGVKNTPRFYQEKAVNKAIEAVIKGRRRALINMATGTGKTFTSVQLVYKLKKSKVAQKILFIVDRNILADQAFQDFEAVMDKDSCHRLLPKEQKFNQSRDVYFGIYQTLVGSEEEGGRKDRFKEFPPDFFDLIVIDECHRGSASTDSNWFRLLDYFNSAIQIGLTATPKRDESVDTYAYFGNPVITYSLKDGINDGYLSPYVVKRVRTNIDATGFRPQGVIYDVEGQEVEDREYEMTDFERKLSFPARTRAFAYHLVKHLLETDIFGKTIVFCVNQRHAADMAKYVNEAFKHFVKTKGLPDIKEFCVRITGYDKNPTTNKYDDLEKFKNLSRQTPVVVTTSKLLTTGVDVKTVKNVVIFTNIGSMTEFKQIIGRGTRVYETGNPETEKLGFTILEYGNNSTQLFYDDEFDGPPELEIDDGEVIVDDDTEEQEWHEIENGHAQQDENEEEQDEDGSTNDEPFRPNLNDDDYEEIQKHITYRLSHLFMRDQVKTVAESLSLLGPDGKTLSPAEFTSYQCERFRTIYTDASEFIGAWTNLKSRRELEKKIEDMGIQLDTLAELFSIEHNRKDVDLFDIILHLAFGFKFKSKDERVKELKKTHKEFFQNYSTQAMEVLNLLLDIYTNEGYKPLKISPDLFKTQQFSEMNISTLNDVQAVFGSKESMLSAFQFVQTQLYDINEGVAS
jgi:type I restriction enzyme R subunit